MWYVVVIVTEVTRTWALGFTLSALGVRSEGTDA